ncbi:MAG TPA: thioredoxin-dependent thiol peroxidase [Synechococcales cyanobacterium M55_K2018_004]|nr:thioredoxin-dependent thiol peroxidase [Synechococcales cyanobacterium M55_K2018_004]
MALTAGDVAPDFTLPDSNGNPVTLSDLRGKWVVLYFYPKDDTPGCTKEACGFRDAFADYEAKGIVILGVNTNDAKSHTKFVTKYNLPFTLLTDADAQVSTQYDSYGLKKFMGKEYMGISRHTFLIDPEGKIAKVYLKVKPEEHAAQILADLATLTA